MSRVTEIPMEDGSKVGIAIDLGTIRDIVVAAGNDSRASYLALLITTEVVGTFLDPLTRRAISETVDLQKVATHAIDTLMGPGVAEGMRKVAEVMERLDRETGNTAEGRAFYGEDAQKAYDDAVEAEEIEAFFADTGWADDDDPDLDNDPDDEPEAA